MLLAGAALAGCSGHGDRRAAPPTATPSPTGSPSAAPAAAPRLLGVDVAARPTAAQLRRYTTQAGRPPALLLWFQSWGEPLFYAPQAAAARSAGAVPVITWDPQKAGGVSLAAVAAGRYDSYLRRSAAQARSLRGPVLIRLAHEMNLQTWPWNPARQRTDPATFLAFWRHVVDVFRAEGADNVDWVWSPNVDCGGACPFLDLYPGDTYVDWVGLDGYNYGPSRGLAWRSLVEVFRSSYDALTALSRRPVLLTATGTVEQGGSKAAWLRDGLLRDVPADLPRVEGVIYSDRKIEADWSLSTSDASATAWRGVVASPTYAGRYGTTVSRPGVR